MLSSFSATDVLARVQKALQRYRPRRLYQPYSGSPLFDNFLASPQLGIERSTLGILNSTIGFSRNVATILLLQSHVSTFLSNEYSIKAPEHVVVDEAPFTSDDIYEIDQVALAESLTQFRKALNGPKLRTTLKALTSNKAQTLSLRAAVQPVGGDKLALVLTVHDDVATNAGHEENVENYRTKITFG
uniref:DNA helicase n=1 Tax=Mesocestoides corti TaxID=53468 RepID=A0A5K3FDN1_MESCO